MTHHPNHTPDRFGLIPIDKPQPPNPYPERPTNLGGVRQHTPPLLTPARKVTVDHAQTGPLPLAASVRRTHAPQSPDHPNRRRWFPWASAALSAFGQLLLTLAIVVGAIQPLPAIGICLIWMLCSLLLIVAQVVSESPAHRSTPSVGPDEFDELPIPYNSDWLELPADQSDPDWT